MKQADSNSLLEPARTTPIGAECDVLIVGGGPAGLAAAVAAAKHGAHTLLVERYGFLGGMGTAGGVTNLAGLFGRRQGQMQRLVGGVCDGLIDRIAALGGLNVPQDGMGGRIRVLSYDIVAYKCAADEWLTQAGVQLLFHALACDLSVKDQRIDAVVLQTRSGRMAIRAKQVIDATGDADLAAMAGAAYTLGDGQGDMLYPSTMFRIGQVDAPRAIEAVGQFGAIDQRMQAVADRYAFARRGAILRPQRNPTQWRANVTQLRNSLGRAVDATDAWQLSAAEIEGRRQIVAYMKFLRAEVPGFEHADIDEIATQVGIRETRRVHCRHMLDGDEVQDGARFEDSIGLNAWPIETNAKGEIVWRHFNDPDNAFNQLPLRMLMPDAPAPDNLWVAGRCAGMTHSGQSAARASGACLAMGQAAGTAAAMSLSGPWRVPDLQQRLLADGAILS
jgi:hypothetical protein